MSRGIVTRENLEDIADAIRAKLDTDDTYTPAQMAAAIALIHGEPVLQSKTATQNGTVTPDSGYDGLDQVTVDVPNTYGASDEGKVVSNSALVAQTARTVTENGTFDTTLNSSVTVAVPRPAGTLAKKGASSAVSSIPALYGPMGTLSGDYLTPVGFATGANVTLNTAQPYEVKAVFKLTQLPAAQAAIFGHADSASPVPAMYVAAGGGNIQFAVPTPPEVQGGSVVYREGNVYSTDTPLPLNTEITVSIRCNGTSFVVTVDNGTAVTSKSDTDYTPYAGTGGLLLGMDERRENGLAGVSGAYINAEDSAIIQNGTRLWGGVIEGGGGGSEPVIQPLSVTENGTYTPPTGVDGYGPVTVNVSGGGGESDVLVPEYQGLAYSYIGTNGNYFQSNEGKIYYSSYFHVDPNHTYALFVGDTISDRLRAHFYAGKNYSDFEYYVNNGLANQAVFTSTYNISGTSDLSGKDLRQRLLYTPTSEGEIVIVTSRSSIAAVAYCVELP